MNFRGRIIGDLRLYHKDAWEVSDQDIDSLDAVAESIGLSLMYNRVANALRSVKDTVDDIHPIWLESQG